MVIFAPRFFLAHYQEGGYRPTIHHALRMVTIEIIELEFDIAPVEAELYGATELYATPALGHCWHSATFVIQPLLLF